LEHDEQFPWRSTPGVSEEAFHVSVPSGRPNQYRLCFNAPEEEEEEEDDSNTVNAVQLGFHLRVRAAFQRALPDVELGPDAQRALGLLEAATTTEQLWHNLMDHFDFFRNASAIAAANLCQDHGLDHIGGRIGHHHGHCTSLLLEIVL
jgi:hypothetical protein